MAANCADQRLLQTLHIYSIKLRKIHEQKKSTNLRGFRRWGLHTTWCVQVLRSPKEAFVAAVQSWRERCEKCVCLQGDYAEK